MALNTHVDMKTQRYSHVFECMIMYFKKITKMAFLYIKAQYKEQYET